MSTSQWVSETPWHRYHDLTIVPVLPKAEQRRVDKAAREAEDRAHAEELNRRIEGLTGEPAHLRIEKGAVQGFDYDSLSAVLRLVEDVLLQMR